MKYIITALDNPNSRLMVNHIIQKDLRFFMKPLSTPKDCGLRSRMINPNTKIIFPFVLFHLYVIYFHEVLKRLLYVYF